MKRILFSLLGLFCANCVAGGSGGAGGGAAQPVTPGSVCNLTQNTTTCGIVPNGQSALLKCDGSTWILAELCAAGTFCGSGSGKPACPNSAAQADAGTLDSGAGPDAVAQAEVGQDTQTAGTDIAADTPAPDTVDASQPAGYLWVTIDGAPETQPDCTTSSAGADIDVVAIYRNGKLLGVGKPGTVVHKEGASPKCPTWGKSGQCSYAVVLNTCHNDPSDVAGGLTTKMYSTATVDTGYFGISGGTVALKIGACTVATEDLKLCDGKGADISIVAGDEVDVYEVDGTYKKASGTFASGIAPDSCMCIAEDYEVFVSKAEGKGLVSLGMFTGSKSQIKVQ